MSQRTTDERREAGLVGDLESWPLADLLMWLHRTGHTAVVQIGAGFVRGEVFLEKGELRACRWGETEGELALGALLTMTRGGFRVLKTGGNERRPNIFEGTEAVIMRWAVKHDEQESHAAAA